MKKGLILVTVAGCLAAFAAWVFLGKQEDGAEKKSAPKTAKE